MNDRDANPPATCCSPTLPEEERAARSRAARPVPAGRTGAAGHSIDQVSVPGQTFLMGDATGAGNPGDGEIPVHEVWIDGFQLDATSVTNSAFTRFIAETGYRTEAEVFGYSAVFYLALEANLDDILGQPPDVPWWLGVHGADWEHPAGPLSSVEGLSEHPVVHVSWNDALAYCAWAGRRLPTEAEWECASRGGLRGRLYPWGDEWGDIHRCNIWQGVFPATNTREDGWLTTAPVHTFEPNAYGVWQSVGSVWEWCSDWWDDRYYARSPGRNPAGPAAGDQRVMRGGSFLCHDSY